VASAAPLAVNASAAASTDMLFNNFIFNLLTSYIYIYIAGKALVILHRRTISKKSA
jgi:hypothetical protein